MDIALHQQLGTSRHPGTVPGAALPQHWQLCQLLCLFLRYSCTRASGCVCRLWACHTGSWLLVGRVLL